MIVQSLELTNYRNYESLTVRFSEGTNIFYGDNAQGKTNLLEALYLLATTKSHRGMKDKDLIRFGEEEAHVRGVVIRGGIDRQIDMHLRKSRGKGLAINGQRLKKAAELIGLLHIVFFSPEDLRIIKDGPSERRRFMDMELCQLDKTYLHDLTQYNRIVEQRNRLLKDIQENAALADTLDLWDEQILAYGLRIIEKREAFIREVNEIAEEIHRELTGGAEELRLIYEPNVTAEDFAAKLKDNRRRDIRMGMTGNGPHRDDFAFMEREIDLRQFGSQGQQRTCALSLKLAEIELVRRRIGENPILMLDDVLSELDVNRQNLLLGRIGSLQTFITCTGLDELMRGRVRLDRLFRIEKGRIVEDNEEQITSGTPKETDIVETEA